MEQLNRSVLENRKPLWLRRAHEVGHNRLTLAGAAMPPVLVALVISAATSYIGTKKKQDWLIERSKLLSTWNETVEGGMDAIGETKNPIMKAQRFARAYVGSGASAIPLIAALAIAVNSII